MRSPSEELREKLAGALGNDYRIERELTGGGMSQVFVAEDVALGRRVVVKVLPPALSAAVDTQRFRREIALTERRAADALRHFAAADSLPDGPSDDCLPCLAAMRGRAFEVAGQPDSAITAYERYLATPDPYRLWYGTWWHLRDPIMRPWVHAHLADLYAKRGDVTRAARHDSTFVTLWSKADQSLQSRVAQRRARRR